MKEKPKVWCVKNDGSQLFQDTVIKYLNDNYIGHKYRGDIKWNYYGVADNDTKWNATHPSSFNNNILTIEQFKTIFMEEKQLLGYKIKPEHEKNRNEMAKALNVDSWDKFHGMFLHSVQSKDAIRKAKELGVLSLWFDEVYEEDEYKAGDWVTVLSNKDSDDWKFGCNICDKSIVGKTFLVKYSYPSNEKVDWIWVVLEPFGSGISSNQVRKATPEEVENAQKIFICGKEVVFNCSDIKIDGQRYHINELDILAKIMRRGQIKSLNVGCNGQTTVDLQLIEKILKKLK